MRCFIILLVILLPGCQLDNKAQKLNDACDALNGLCDNLIIDNGCQALREETIVQTHQLKQTYSATKRYQQMITLEKYVNCTQQRIWIEYSDPKNNVFFNTLVQEQTLSEDDTERLEKYRLRHSLQKNNRIKTHNYANALLEDLNKITNGDQSHWLLYWHWSRNSSRTAMNALITLDNVNKITEPEILFALAQQYSHRNLDKAISVMLKSLSLYPKKSYNTKHSALTKLMMGERVEDPLHLYILRSLTTLFYRMNAYENSYLFAKLTALNNDTSVKETMIVNHFRLKSDNFIQALDKRAETLHKKLKKGQFNRDCYDFPAFCLSI